MSFIPGMFPGEAVSSSIVELTTITQITSSTSTSSTITAPADVRPGDIIILLDIAAGPYSAPSSVTPSGFTSISDITSGKVRQIVSRKLCDGSEDSATITGMNGAAGNGKALYLFRGNIAATSISVSGIHSEATSGDPSSQTVASGSGIAPLVVIGCYGATTGIDPRTFTVGGSAAKDGEVSPATTPYLAYKIYNTSPSDVVVDMDDEGTNCLQSFYFKIS